MAGKAQNTKAVCDAPAWDDSASDGRPGDSDLLGWSSGELEAFLVNTGHKPIHAEAIWGNLHRRWVSDLADMVDVPERVLHSMVAAGLTVGRPTVVRAESSQDGFTRKFLLRLSDGELVESVLMRYKGRATACVSTQAGCAMGCVFCATGQGGFRRHLRAGEIVGQVLHVARILRDEDLRLRNLVLMGQGEPLHNYDAVMRAVETVIDGKGLSLAAIRVTLSTVGLVPGIRRLAEEKRPMALAVSLHAANDAQREALVPVARRWPLADLMAACRYFSERTDRRIFFEWTLIEGQNDGPEEAAELARLLKGQRAHVNLIPLNPTAGFGGEPSGLVRARAFQSMLKEAGFVSTIRQRRGIDIDAGCGQLAATV